jgi:5-enolpyruvylshikimate-3-phosphate synthase
VPVECFEVTGGTSLTGRVRVTGAKNSALKLMAAALLAAGRTTIDEVPDILDVAIMSEVLRRLGCEVSYERHELRRWWAGWSSTSPTSPPRRPTTTWSAGCGPRSACWARSSPVRLGQGGAARR